MKSLLRRATAIFYRRYLRPRSRGVDNQRREFILNILLAGLFMAASVALIITLFHHITDPQSQDSGSLWSTIIFWAVITSLSWLSRHGRHNLAAIILVSLLLLSSLDFVVLWGFGLPIAELLFALTIVIAGVLFAAPLALLATAVVVVCLLATAYGQTSQLLVPKTYWQRQPFELGDAIGFIVVLTVMGLVSWLSNREIDRSLKRARRSEAALQTERDNLEIKVAARTEELEQLQLARLLEMQRFAEFGRIGAGLLHEVANPLTAASLHLEQLSKQQHSELVRQIQKNLHYLERYLAAARKQLKRESKMTAFSVAGELKQVTSLLAARARQAGVEVKLERPARYRLYGDAVKFSQLVANLLANAIDAYDKTTSSKPRIVNLKAEDQGDWLELTVSDNGVGISASNLDHLFEPFFSTKAITRDGLGIGLALVKQYVEEDFHGSIAVTSSRQQGTRFTVRLKNQVRP